MALFRCKMCGGTIEFNQGDTVGVCDSCGTKLTLPKTNDDVIANLFNRANNLRLKCEFDKAATVYEKIVEQDDSEAEAHWGIVLCKYGIEYVEDPKSGKRIPTCHRTLFDAVTTEPDYLAAIDYSDACQQIIYESEARAIDRIQKDILAIVKNEKPFDVFICYKESDENGKRTIDSALANDIYYQLTSEGLKVFYAAITLEDKLGQEYEPYIFAALNSAKVMLVVGTKPEYFSAVWVKNEWSRFMVLMKTDRTKLLIPCYRDMDAYDLPEEFAHLQAQDMSKIGFINDVVRGIKKLISDGKPAEATKETVVVNNAGGNVAPLLERVFLFLEDGKWQDADIYCEKVLDIDPKNAEAYIGKLMIELQIKSRKQLADCKEPFDNLDYYIKVLRFGDDKIEAEMRGYIKHINDRNENESMTEIYNKASVLMKNSTRESVFLNAASMFDEILNFKDSKELSEKCKEKAEQLKQERLAREEAARLEAERKAEEKRIADEKAKKKRKKIISITIPIGCVFIAFLIILNTVILPNKRYNQALECMSNGEILKATRLFQAVSNHKDVWDTIAEHHSITAGNYHTVGLKSNGTVVATGTSGYGECDVSDWTDIVAVSAGGSHTVGLKSNGTVVAVGCSGDGQCDVTGWTDIVAISAGKLHTVGLKSDGTVIATGDKRNGQCDVSDWTDIKIPQQ